MAVGIEHARRRLELPPLHFREIESPNDSDSALSLCSRWVAVREGNPEKPKFGSWGVRGLESTLLIYLWLTLPNSEKS